MNYAIIGKGFIYDRHVQAILKTGGRVLMTCDNDPSKQANFTDWVEMYHHPDFTDVDCVVICTPNYLHSVMTREALLRGKKVICEKPLSIDGIKGLGGVVPVLQLRYHPNLKDLKPKEVYVEAKMYRDDKYWDGWKGDKVKSGGILYNLGIHYIDLLVYLLGRPLFITKSRVDDKVAFGEIVFEKGTGKFYIEIVNDKEEQGRKLIADEKEVNLSNRENLSYEDLHKHIYEDFVRGEAMTLDDARVSLETVDWIINVS